MKVLTSIIFFALSGSIAFAAEPAKDDAPKVLSSSNGRFVFGQISDMRRDQFMLDTKTGRLWRIVTTYIKKPDGTQGEGYPVLEPVPFLTDAGKEVSEPKL